MRGRRPKPTAQRELEGNAGKRPLNVDEPTPPPLQLEPEPTSDGEKPPAELGTDETAIAEWQRLAPMLRRCRQITEADRAALIALCLEWARYLYATGQVKQLGLVVRSPSGYPMTNPYLSIATKALAGCNKLWPELGLTPSSRSRVKAAPGAETDAFSEFDQPPATATAH